MNRSGWFLTGAFILFFGMANAQLSGGGDLNPDLSPPKEAQEKWMDLRVGLSVHWGPSSLGGEEISWSRQSIIPKEVYDNYYKAFTPDKFDAEEWAKLMNRWGIKYMAPTAKHHDGFCLWFSDYSEYDMENAGLQIDLMKELAEACKKYDIMFGAYYSNLDWYHPDWAPYQYGGPGPLFEKRPDSPNLDRYFKFFENQCIELIENYDLDFIQFDGEWDSTYTHEIGSELYRKFHEVKPEILLNSRIDIGRRSVGAGNHLYMDGLKYCGDFQDRERLVKHGNNVIAWLDHPWQAWVTIDKNQWSYNKKPLLMAADELIRDMVSVVGNNGNYMINLGPRPDGSFEAEQIVLMDELGKWLKKHEQTIYATRGGPFYPFPQGVSTRKDNKAWIFITDPKTENLILPKLSQQILTARIFGTQDKVDFYAENEMLVFDVDKMDYPGPVKVIELTFKEDVKMAEKKANKNVFEIQGAKKISKGISIELSSRDEQWNDPDKESHLIGEDTVHDYAFHTQSEKKPFVLIDLGETTEIHGLVIFNRETCCQNRANALTVWYSGDGKNWEKHWSANSNKDQWEIPFTQKSMGAEITGKKMRFIKVGLDNEVEQVLHLKKIDIYAK